MSQSDLDIANISRSLFRAEVNAALQALASQSSGATEPSITYAFQLWADTTSGKLKQRNAANDAWIEKGDLASADWGYLKKSNPVITGLLNLDDGADIASASTVDLTAATGNTVRITGTTAITAFTMNAGQQMELIAVGALPLTYNATTMNINGGVSYTCAAGDRLQVFKDGGGVVRVNVTKQNGTAVVPTELTFASQSDYNTGADTTKPVNSAILRGNNIVRGTPIPTTSGTAHDFTGIPSWAKRITVVFNGVSTNGASNHLIRLGTSGGVETSGYSAAMALANAGGASAGSTDTTGFLCGVGGSAGNAFYGALVLTAISNNTWVCSGSLGITSSTITGSTLGGKILVGTLDRIRLTTVNGTDAFDAGSVTIIWE